MRNQILYIGYDDAYANSISSLLGAHTDQFHLDVARDLNEIQRMLAMEKYDLLLLDSTFVEKHDHLSLEKVLEFTDRYPILMVVDKGQENLGKFALEKGAFDYIVRIEGADTAVPLTLDRALQCSPQTTEISFEFGTGEEVPEITSFFEMNETGRFLSFDDNLSEILGVDRSQLLRSYLMDFIAEEDREKFYQWRATYAEKSGKFRLSTEIIHKEKGIIPVEIELQTVVKPELYFSGFQGYIRTKHQEQELLAPEVDTELIPLFHELYQLNEYLRQGLFQLFLHKIAQLPTQYFHFQFSALYLYEPSQGRFLEELSIGEPYSENGTNFHTKEFSPQDVQEVFPGNEFVSLAHQSLLSEQERSLPLSGRVSLFTRQNWSPGNEWRPGDRLLLNLRGKEGSPGGFLLLEKPTFDRLPGIHFLRNLELYTIFISSLFEAFLRQEDLENRLRQLKQVFTVLETYDLEQPIDGLLKEVVWTIKFALRFELVAVAILSNTTRQLHIRGAAMEGKEKLNAVLKLSFSLSEIRPLLKEKYRLVNSFLISQKRTPFNLLKRLLGKGRVGRADADQWGPDDILLVPIRLKSNRIVGFLILDQPANRKRPTAEEVQILEKISRLIGVAIENKLLYSRLKGQLYSLAEPAKELPSSNSQGELNKTRIRRIFQLMNKSK